MLSQDEMLHNSPMLRSSKAFVSATSETGHPFQPDLVIGSLFPMNSLTNYEKHRVSLGHPLNLQQTGP
jgi:hypothetical protein